MKKLMLLFTLLFIIGQVTFAKDKAPKTAEERAERTTKKLTEKLSLTADQVTKVKAISLTKAEKMDQAKAKAGADEKKKHAEFKAIKQQWEADLKGILTSQQYDAYLKYKEERKAQKKAKHSDKKKNQGDSKANDDHDHLD